MNRLLKILFILLGRNSQQRDSLALVEYAQADNVAIHRGNWLNFERSPQIFDLIVNGRF